jgi:hypothetical protein
MGIEAAEAMAVIATHRGIRPYGAGRSDETYQVCGKVGHIALNYWKRFNKGYRGPDKSAGAT